MSLYEHQPNDKILTVREYQIFTLILENQDGNFRDFWDAIKKEVENFWAGDELGCMERHGYAVTPLHDKAELIRCVKELLSNKQPQISGLTLEELRLIRDWRNFKVTKKILRAICDRHGIDFYLQPIGKSESRKSIHSESKKAEIVKALQITFDIEDVPEPTAEDYQEDQQAGLTHDDLQEDLFDMVA